MDNNTVNMVIGVAAGAVFGAVAYAYRKEIVEITTTGAKWATAHTANGLAYLTEALDSFIEESEAAEKKPAVEKPAAKKPAVKKPAVKKELANG
jgi:hypothetical protein